MRSTASIETLGDFVDEGGGAGYYEDGDPVTFPCRVMPMDKTADLREALSGGQLDVTRHVLMTYPTRVTEVNSETNVTVDGVEYEVVGVPPIGTYSQHRTALLRKIQSEGVE